jgi:hypothetical protein
VEEEEEEEECKGKFIPVHAMMAYSWRSGVALVFFLASALGGVQGPPHPREENAR